MPLEPLPPIFAEPAMIVAAARQTGYPATRKAQLPGSCAATDHRFPRAETVPALAHPEQAVASNGARTRTGSAAVREQVA